MNTELSKYNSSASNENNYFSPEYQQHQNKSQLQKVSSIYQIHKQNAYNNNKSPYQNVLFKKNSRQNSSKIQFIYQNRGANLNEESSRQFIKNIHNFKQNIQNRPYQKNDTQTNVVSSNFSLNYESQQEPSFSNKQQITIFEDSNLEIISPVKPASKRIIKFEDQNKSITSNFKQNFMKQKINNHKITKIFQFIQELKFMKEGLESKIKQQKVQFNNSIQELKKFLFQLNIKIEKQVLQISRQRVTFLRNSSQKQQFDTLSSKQNNLSEQSKQYQQLHQYCSKLEQEKLKQKQKYQKMLKMYQQEIESLSKEFQTKTILQNYNQKNLKQSQCKKCEHNQYQVQNLQSYQLQIYKNRLIQQQQKHVRAMKRLQQKVLELQQEFQNLQKNKKQAQKQIKQKQKNLTYQESQIEYRMKNIQKRQRDLQIAQKMIQQQRIQLQNKKEKISDYQLKIFKQQRKQKQLEKEKDFRASQYFRTAQRRQILQKSNPNIEKSSSRTSLTSKIDISSRLKQIQMIKIQGIKNYGDSFYSRNSSNQKHLVSYNNLPLYKPTVNTNLKQHNKNNSILASPKQYHSRQNNQSIKLNEKLNSLTQTLEKQLKEIN